MSDRDKLFLFNKKQLPYQVFHLYLFIAFIHVKQSKGHTRFLAKKFFQKIAG